MSAALKPPTGNEAKPREKKQSLGFAIDRFAARVVANCPNEEELQQMKSLAKAFCSSLASAIDRVVKN